jgi:RNA polymerase sigma-70 factor (ECF subfamily)
MSLEISKEQLEKLVEAAAEGSVEDFHQLYEIFSAPIYKFVLGMAGSEPEAEDITQETFIKVFYKLKELKDPGQFKFWLYRIARNEVFQRYRKLRRRGEVSIDNEEIGYYEFLADDKVNCDPEEIAISKELGAVVQQAVLSLKPKYRDVFILAVQEKMSYEEISQITGKSMVKVKTDIYRARQAIRKKLRIIYKTK